MTDTADTTVSTKPAASMTPREFVEQLERLAVTRSAAEVAAFYDRHGPAVQPLLRGNDRLSVAAIMEVADTVVEYETAVRTNGTATATPENVRPPAPSAPPRGHS